MLLIKAVLRHVLLVKHVVVLHAGCDGVILVFDANREPVGQRMTSEIAAEELIVKPALGVHRMRIVHGEKAAPVIYEVPDSFLLSVGHPGGLRLAVALGPVAAVAGDDQQ